MPETQGADNDGPKFLRDQHVAYLLKVLEGLPSPYASQESNRLTLSYFAVAGLDLLNALDKVNAKEIIPWIYSLQVLPRDNGEATASLDDKGESVGYGFRGSPSAGAPYSPQGAHAVPYDGGHIAMTYTALAILRILGDDYGHVQKEAIVKTLRRLQKPNGSFTPVVEGTESDMRFVFCAAAISAMLDNWTGMDVDLTADFIHRSQAYDEGFGLNPGLESHGGATYCALASLKLMGRLDGEYPEAHSGARPSLEKAALVDWCMQRQVSDQGGFQGRCNKDADTCYAFWVGGSLEMLGAYSMVNKEHLREFLYVCQNESGGFSKLPFQRADLLHTFYGICGFSLLGEPSLWPIYSPLGMSKRAAGPLMARLERPGIRGSSLGHHDDLQRLGIYG